MGVQIGLRRTNRPDQRRELLEDVRDGQGLTVQRCVDGNHRDPTRTQQHKVCPIQFHALVQVKMFSPRHLPSSVR